MPTFTSTQNTQQPQHHSHPGSVQTLSAHTAELYHTRVSYPLVGTEAAADVINLCVLPVGATLLPQLCSVYSSDPGTTLTLDVGYAANPDAFADGIVLSAGGMINFSSGTAPSGLTALEPITTGQVTATVDSANTLTAAVVLYFNLVWRLPKAA